MNKINSSLKTIWVANKQHLETSTIDIMHQGCNQHFNDAGEEKRRDNKEEMINEQEAKLVMMIWNKQRRKGNEDDDSNADEDEDVDKDNNDEEQRDVNKDNHYFGNDDSSSNRETQPLTRDTKLQTKVEMSNQTSYKKYIKKIFHNGKNRSIYLSCRTKRSKK
jgi:hypothetical protein